MPVWKFHSISDMTKYKGYTRKKVALKTNELFALLNTALPPLCRRGVQKFRNIEEANNARRLLEIERAKFINKKT
ncbi:MAG: hypothetical protein ABIH00_02655 [Armatimonadota bacterium]